MNDVILDGFFERLDDKNYKLSLGMRDMVNRLPEYLARRMKEYWEKERAESPGSLPFKKVFVWDGNRRFCVLEFDFDGKLHAVDTICFEDRYELKFFLRPDESKGEKGSGGFPDKALDKIGETESWNLDERDSRAKRSFPFDNPQEGEEKMKEYLSAFFKKLFANS